jgi:hypothetical protein
MRTLLLSAAAIGAVTGAAQAATDSMMPSPALSGVNPLYSKWANGPSTSPNFFPLAVWYQNPMAVGAYGAYPSLASAVAGEKMNIFLGFAGLTSGLASWPENFGSDAGELETIKAHNLYAIGGLVVPSTQDTAAGSVASMLALAKSIGATSNLIGYNAGDEPNCAQASAEPAVVAALTSYDPTRMVAYNQNHWMTAPAYYSCLPALVTGLQSAGVTSADFYPLTDPWNGNSAGFPKSDFLSVPNDTLFMQGVMVQGLAHFGAPGQPVWAYVESGSDNFGMSEGANFMSAAVTSGSPVLTMANTWTKFTKTWIGLTISGPGIPPNARVVSIIDSTHATLSAVATATSSSENVNVTGGIYNSDCVASVNLCVVQGNEYRPTVSQVNSEVWNSIINGANGIEYFCHDLTSYAFCLGNGSPAAVAAQQNITYINTNILKFAPVLNAPTVGQCSMQQQNYTTSAGWTTTTSCSGGILTMSTTNQAVPGLAIAKVYNGITYIIAQSDRRSTYGAIFHFTVAGLARRRAMVVYDSNAQYDPANSSQGHGRWVDRNGVFNDVLGANNDHYQVRIYAIQD